MTIVAFKGKAPKIEASVLVSPMSSIIGDVEIGADSSIWPFVSIRGDMHTIKIGSKTSIQDNSVLHITHSGHYSPGGFPLTIGDQVTIGHKATLHGCTIHNRCLVGMDSTILDGAILESDIILGAGSLVSPGKRLKSGYLYVGRPAIQKRPLTTEEIEMIVYSAENYVKLKNEYLQEQS